MGDWRFQLRNQYTGEITMVEVDPDKTALFSDRSIFTERPEACPFFRFVTGKGYCTVHLTRPAICKDYGCWRLLILDKGGNRAGRIKCQRFLASEDQRLTRIFDKEINATPEPDDTVWDERLITVLTREGYTVRR